MNNVLFKIVGSALASLAVVVSVPATAGPTGGNRGSVTSYDANGTPTGSVVVSSADPCRDVNGNWTGACGETSGQLLRRDAAGVLTRVIGAAVVRHFDGVETRRTMRDAAGYRQAEIAAIGSETRLNQDNATDNNIRLNTSLYELQRRGGSPAGTATTAPAGNGNVRVNTNNCGETTQNGRTVRVCEVIAN